MSNGKGQLGVKVGLIPETSILDSKLAEIEKSRSIKIRVGIDEASLTRCKNKLKEISVLTNKVNAGQNIAGGTKNTNTRAIENTIKQQEKSIKTLAKLRRDINSVTHKVNTESVKIGKGNIYQSKRLGSYGAKLAEAKQGADAIWRKGSVSDKDYEKILAAQQAVQRIKDKISSIAMQTRLRNVESGEWQRWSNLTQQMNTYWNTYGNHIKKNSTLMTKWNQLQAGVKTHQWSSADLRYEFSKFSTAAREAGVEVDSFNRKLARTTGSRVRPALAGAAVFGSVIALKQALDNVRKIDSAMTELRKVTNASKQEYADFLDEARIRTHQYGGTLEEIINSTADFARLGYNIKEATNLANTAVVYKNVGDDIANIDQASKSIISTMQGFNIDASRSMEIADKFNEVANNYPTSAGHIGDGLQRSAAALSAAGNSLDESIGLFTAGQSVVQNAESMGTVLKTMSMRLRGSTTDLKAAGLETQGMASSTSKLRKEIMSLTGGFDIMDETGTKFKSTFKIMEGISAKWDEMTDVSRASLLELIAGKRNANAAAAIIKNFDMAKKAMQTAKDSEGSALRENEKVLDSIAGRANKLAASWQSLSTHMLDTDSVKQVVSALDGLVSVLDKLLSLTGSLPLITGAIGGLFSRDLIGYQNTEIAGKRSHIEDSWSEFAKRHNAKGGKKTFSKNLGDITFNETDMQKIAKATRLATDDTKGFNSALHKMSAESAEVTRYLREMGVQLDNVSGKRLKRGVDGSLLSNAKKLADNSYGVSTSSEYLNYKNRKSMKAWQFDQKSQATSGVKSGLANISAEAIERSKGVVDKVKGFATEAGKAMLGGLVIAGATTLVSMAVDALATGWYRTVHSQEYFAEQIATANAEYKAKSDEAKTLSASLAEVERKIDNLKKKSRLTLTEEEDLKRLKKEAELLQYQLELVKEQVKVKAKAKNDKNWEALTDLGNIKKGDKNFDVVHPVSDGNRYARDVKDKYGVGAALEALKKEENRIQAQLNKAVSDRAPESEIKSLKSNLDNAKEAYKDYAANVNKYIKSIDLDMLSGKEKKYIARLQNTLLKNKLKSKDIGVEDALKEAGAVKESTDLSGAFRDNFRRAKIMAKYKNTFKSKTLASSEKGNFGSFLDDTFGKEFRSKASDIGLSLDDLYNHFYKFTKINTFKPKFNLTEVLGDLQKAKADLSTITGANKEFAENHIVSVDTLAKISQQFGSLGDVTARYVQTLGNSKSTMGQVKQATSDLVTAYINSGDVLSHINEKNKGFYAAQLRSMGVTNANTVANYASARAVLANGNATDRQKAIAWNTITAINGHTKALKWNANMAAHSKEMTEAFGAAEQYVAGSNFAAVVSQHAGALQLVATWAYGASSALAQYAAYAAQIGDINNQIRDADRRNKNWIGKIGNKWYGTDPKALRKERKDLIARQKKLAKRAKKQLRGLAGTKVNVKPPNINAPSGGGGGGGGASAPTKSKADIQREKAQKASEIFDKKQTRLKEQLDDNEISVATYYKKLTKLANKYLKHVKGNRDKYRQAMRQLREDVYGYFEKDIDKVKEKIASMDKFKTWAPNNTPVKEYRKEWEKVFKAYKKGILTYKQFASLTKNLRDLMADAQKDINSKAKDSIDKLVEMTSAMLKKRQEEIIEKLNKQKEKLGEIIDKKKEILELDKEQLEYEQDLTDAAKRITKLQTQIAALSFDNSRAGKAKSKALQEELAEAQKDLGKKQRDHAYNAENRALDKLKESFDKGIDERTNALQKEMENVGDWLKRTYDYIKKHPTKLLKELTQYNYKWGDGLNLTVKNMWADSKKLLKSYKFDIAKIIDKLTKLVDENNNKSLNYKSKKRVIAENKPSVTRRRSDKANLSPQRQADVHSKFGANAYYDKKSNIWYTNASKKVTIEAAELIAKMKANRKSKKQLQRYLKQLRKMTGYKNANIAYDKKTKSYHLYKNKKRKTQIFHDGLAGGFVNGIHTAKQDEAYALLKSGELVLSKKDQMLIAKRLQLTSKIAEAIHGKGDSLPHTSGLISGGININIDAPVEIHGGSNKEIAEMLKKQRDEISKQTLNQLNSALGKKGFRGGVGSNALRK